MRKAERDKLIDRENRTKLTLEEVKYRTKKLHPNIEILTDHYENDKARFTVRCNKEGCGHVFETTYNNLRQKNSCARCYNRRRKLSQEEFERRTAKAVPWFEPLEKFDGVQKKMHFRCRECGHIHKSTPVNIWKGTQCQQCRKRKREEFLKEHENRSKNTNK